MKKTLILILVSCFAIAQETSWYQAQSTTEEATLIKYTSNYKLRQDRKVGAGIGIGGALGGLGGLIELNIEDENATLVGFGSGPGYQTFGLAWKRSFEGEYFTPYTTAGYARWWNSGSKSQSNKSSLLKNFLSDEERQKKNFGLSLLTGAIGMQYNQLSGELAGSSFYIEFGGLLSIENTKIMPTGSVGAFYYF